MEINDSWFMGKEIRTREVFSQVAQTAGHSPGMVLSTSFTSHKLVPTLVNLRGRLFAVFILLVCAISLTRVNALGIGRVLFLTGNPGRDTNFHT